MREPTNGVVVAKVDQVDDPERLGRVRVRFPWLSESNRSRWASMATIMTGPERGVFFMPRIDDEVLIVFEQGDWDHPYIIGCIWNEQQRPPSESVDQRMICSVNNHKIRFLDPDQSGAAAADPNKGVLTIEDAHENKIVMTNSLMRIICNGRLEISATASVSIQGREVDPMTGII